MKIITPHPRNFKPFSKLVFVILCWNDLKEDSGRKDIYLEVKMSYVPYIVLNTKIVYHEVSGREIGWLNLELINTAMYKSSKVSRQKQCLIKTFKV